jgi:hypothetical protein
MPIVEEDATAKTYRWRSSGLVMRGERVSGFTEPPNAADY